MRLANGSSKTENILLARVDVTVHNRVIPTTFIIIPEVQNRTLLGVDFIIGSKIQLNIADGTLNFSNY